MPETKKRATRPLKEVPERKPRKSRPLNGPELDKALALVLSQMKAEGYHVSPITKPAVERRLGLGSRATLLKPERKAMIEQAAEEQLRQAKMDRGEIIRRKTQAEKMESLVQENAKLQEQLNHLRDLQARIVFNATALGYDVDKLLEPLKSNTRHLER